MFIRQTGRNKEELRREEGQKILYVCIDSAIMKWGVVVTPLCLHGKVENNNNNINVK